ncbi:hypothetical protein ACTHPJ_23960 [Paenibacillus amylolyticus]|uniref:hypothetical protein n=1 Tax=Paenibacillus amylolyticus TaxID=1451 RepID=UPI003F7EE77B
MAENTERRGEAEADPVKKGRQAVLLKEYWEIKNNGDHSAGLFVQRSMKDVADSIGENERTTQRLINTMEMRGGSVGVTLYQLG